MQMTISFDFQIIAWYVLHIFLSTASDVKFLVHRQSVYKFFDAH